LPVQTAGLATAGGTMTVTDEVRDWPAPGKVRGDEVKWPGAENW